MFQFGAGAGKLLGKSRLLPQLTLGRDMATQAIEIAELKEEVIDLRKRVEELEYSVAILEGRIDDEGNIIRWG